MTERQHQPVLLAETAGLLSPRPEGVYVDCTVGLGGHAREILERSAPGGRLIGFDRDAETLALTRERLAEFGGRVTLHHGDYRTLAECEPDLSANGILADLGLSSLQLDDPLRGFSFRHEGPLDMRYDRSGGTGAADLLNRLPRNELVGILRRFGQEPRATSIAGAIIRQREREPLKSTGDLRRAVHSLTGPRQGRRTDPATRTFQAVRIAVNSELEGLELFLETAAEHLADGGVLAVIAYHSLEDRAVKRTFTKLTRPCSCPPGLPVCVCGHGSSPFALHTAKAIVPGEAEQQENPRCRSAKLRGLRRTEKVAA
jgi:16S rRNA (cytosine1402-N4)-methyltransferase